MTDGDPTRAGQPFTAVSDPATPSSPEPLDIPFTFDPNRGLPRPPEGFVRDAVPPSETPAELTEALDRLESSAFDNGMLTERHGKIPRNVELGEQTAAAHSVICALFDGQREEIKALEKETAMYVASLSSQLERLKAEQISPTQAGWLLKHAHIVLTWPELAESLRRLQSKGTDA